MRELIADTSALYALVDRDDVHHDSAVAFLKDELENLTLIVLEPTLFETLSLVKTRLGRAPASKTLEALEASPRARVAHLDPEEMEAVWEVFRERADSSLSAFDCAILAYARLHGIEEVFAVDGRFEGVEGLSRIFS
jgi:predicted nucleic acid-binding protein